MRAPSTKRTLVPLTLAASLLLAWIPPAIAYTPGSDVLVFWDGCDRLMYAMEADGSGRRLVDTSGRMNAFDVSTDGAAPTVLASGPVDPEQSFGQPSTLYALDPDGSRGPVDLLSEDDPSLGGPAAFSPDGSRIAYIHRVEEYDEVLRRLVLVSQEIVIGDVVRDGGGVVVGLDNATTVVDLLDLGDPADSAANPRYVFTGDLDFSRDGRSIVVVIYDDLWRVFLAEDGHGYAGAVPLTRTTDFAERVPRWSPVADVVAFGGGPYTSYDGGLALTVSNTNVYTLDVASGSSRLLTTSKNKGSSGVGRDKPSWSPDGRSILYHAQGQSAFGKRSQPCGNLVNYDLFRIPADGSAKAVAVTNTAGTSVEMHPAWGWSE
jgi:Tol biopolymer transport system component